MRGALQHVTRREETIRDRFLTPVLTAIPPWISPDMVSGLRLILVCAAVVMYVCGIGLVIQVAVLLVAAVTDMVDGPLARLRQTASTRGAVIDQTIDWALGGWLGILSCLHGLISLWLACLMIVPQLLMFAYRTRPGTLPGGFVPDTVSRAQFFFVITGFGALLLSRATGWSWLYMLGISMLALEIVVAWLLAGRAIIQATAWSR